jgi:hypothetical protein
LLLIVPSFFNSSLVHGFINNATEVNFWKSFFCQIFDRRTFAATGQTDKGDNFAAMLACTHGDYCNSSSAGWQTGVAAGWLC